MVSTWMRAARASTRKVTTLTLAHQVLYASVMSSVKRKTIEQAILYDVNDHGLDNWVASIQETFLIITLGSRADARRYDVEDAIVLRRRARAVGRELGMIVEEA